MLMAIPNELFNRIDSHGSATELWDELEKQMLGSEKSVQTRMNQCISAYEGFRARENESITEFYNRFNVILIRRNGIQNSMSEINYKFLKNLKPEWNTLAANFQMNKNMSEEDIHDLYNILFEQEETSENSSADSNDDIREFSKKLALLTKKFQKRFGKKKFVKYDKSKGKEVKQERFSKARDQKETNVEESKCFNCGKPGHFIKNCHFKKFKDSSYYLKKAYITKALEDDKALVAEEESWLIDSSDDEAAHFTQVNM
ncbi:uncharacterized protein LOC112503037 [Cynara cardunculus var. scolymus]|uniref:uncharacterized protein LOC112503037 n=1 Tax=Cynara cardunculus var. scolymus TaxID=59895 RepID=UPI000D627BA0|nr:uncharacterized protein LOC112503037 [Cynara cardunculus var. scolymus]